MKIRKNLDVILFPPLNVYYVKLGQIYTLNVAFKTITEGITKTSKDRLD